MATAELAAAEAAKLMRFEVDAAGCRRWTELGVISVSEV